MGAPSVNHFRSFAFLGLLLACALYSYWQTTKDFVWIVPYMEDRLPAAIRDSQNYKELIDKPLRVFKREAIASSISLKPEGHRFFVSFGHFPVQGSKGPNFLCFEYPFVKLKLRGEGMAVAGKQTQLLVVAPCRHQSERSDFISDIEIPFDDMFRRPAQDVQWVHEQGKFSSEIHLINVLSAWPEQWQLESIQFLRDKNDIHTDAETSISGDEIFKNRGGPLLIQLTR